MKHCRLRHAAIVLVAALTLTAATRVASAPTIDGPPKPHTLSMIPGPVEVHEDVLRAFSTMTTSHLDPYFINVFGETLEMLRDVVLTKTGQPIIMAGSGTLGWDMVATNLIEPGEAVLVLNTGFFGSAFADCLEVYGANVTQLKAAAPGDASIVAEVVAALKLQTYKAITITHVDTSSAVLEDVKALTTAVRAASPDTLIVVDGVCSVGAEELRMDEWGIDVILTASQKALGAPPGLCVVFASERALAVVAARKTPIATYFASWRRWVPVMVGYEARVIAYFATPPVQGIMALHASLKMILAAGTMEERFAQHVAVSERVKAEVESWGLRTVPTSRAVSAHTLTAIYYPAGVTLKEFLPRMLAQNVIIAGGLLPELSAKYFRVGHMSLSACDEARGHITATLAAVRAALEGVLGSKLPQLAAAGKTEL